MCDINQNLVYDSNDIVETSNISEINSNTGQLLFTESGSMYVDFTTDEDEVKKRVKISDICMISDISDTSDFVNDKLYINIEDNYKLYIFHDNKLHALSSISNESCGSISSGNGLIIFDTINDMEKGDYPNNTFAYCIETNQLHCLSNYKWKQTSNYIIVDSYENDLQGSSLYNIEGMIAYCKEDQKTYQNKKFDGITEWVEFSSGSGSSNYKQGQISIDLESETKGTNYDPFNFNISIIGRKIDLSVKMSSSTVSKDTVGSIIWNNKETQHTEDVADADLRYDTNNGLVIKNAYTGTYSFTFEPVNEYNGVITLTISYDSKTKIEDSIHYENPTPSMFSYKFSYGVAFNISNLDFGCNNTLLFTKYKNNNKSIGHLANDAGELGIKYRRSFNADESNIDVMYSIIDYYDDNYSNPLITTNHIIDTSIKGSSDIYDKVNIKNLNAGLYKCKVEFIMNSANKHSYEYMFIKEPSSKDKPMLISLDKLKSIDYNLTTGDINISALLNILIIDSKNDKETYNLNYSTSMYYESESIYTIEPIINEHKNILLSLTTPIGNVQMGMNNYKFILDVDNNSRVFNIDETYRSLVINVKQDDVVIESEFPNYIFNSSRTDTNTNVTIWKPTTSNTSTNISIELNGFNHKTNGFILNSDKNKILKFNGYNNYAILNSSPFIKGKLDTNTGDNKHYTLNDFTLEVKFKINENYKDGYFIDCTNDNNVGFKISENCIYYNPFSSIIEEEGDDISDSLTHTISCRFDTESIHTASFILLSIPDTLDDNQPEYVQYLRADLKDSNNVSKLNYLALLYIDGYLSGISGTTNYSFNFDNYVDSIYFGSSHNIDGFINGEIYCIRHYIRALSSNEILSNYVAYEYNTDNKLYNTLLNKNGYDNNGTGLLAPGLASKLPYAILEIRNANLMALDNTYAYNGSAENVKKLKFPNVSARLIDNNGNELFNLAGCEMKVQGTSSINYCIKNYRLTPYNYKDHYNDDGSSIIKEHNDGFIYIDNNDVYEITNGSKYEDELIDTNGNKYGTLLYEKNFDRKSHLDKNGESIKAKKEKIEISYEINGKLEKWAKSNIFTLKADYMESSHVRNTGIAIFANEYMGSNTIPPQQSGSPYLKYEMDENQNYQNNKLTPLTNDDGSLQYIKGCYGICHAISGFPILIRYSPNFKDKLQDKGIYVFNIDKSADKPFGFDEYDSVTDLPIEKLKTQLGEKTNNWKYGACVSYEIANNSSDNEDMNAATFNVDLLDLNKREASIKSIQSGIELRYSTDDYETAVIGDDELLKLNSNQFMSNVNDENVDIYNNPEDRPNGILANLLIWIHDCNVYKDAHPDDINNSKFKKEFELHFDKTNVLRYIILVEFLGIIDNLAKNMFITTWNAHEEQVIYNNDKTNGTSIDYNKSKFCKWYLGLYDLDTSLGLNNTGNKSIKPTIEIKGHDLNKEFGIYANDVKDIETKTYDCNNSLLWELVYYYFKSEIIDEYNNMRNNKLTYDNIINIFNVNFFNKIGQYYYNQDAFNKYFGYNHYNDAKIYFNMCNGNQESHIKSWLKDRIIYLDTKYNYNAAGIGGQRLLEFRNKVDANEINKTVGFAIMPIKASYSNMNLGDQQTSENNQLMSHNIYNEFSFKAANDMNQRIYYSDLISSIDGIAGMNPTSFAFEKLTNLNSVNLTGLKDIKTVSFSSNNLQQIKLKNTSVETINVYNLQNLLEISIVSDNLELNTERNIVFSLNNNQMFSCNTVQYVDFENVKLKSYDFSVCNNLISIGKYKLTVSNNKLQDIETFRTWCLFDESNKNQFLNELLINMELSLKNDNKTLFSNYLKEKTTDNESNICKIINIANNNSDINRKFYIPGLVYIPKACQLKNFKISSKFIKAIIINNDNNYTVSDYVGTTNFNVDCENLEYLYVRNLGEITTQYNITDNDNYKFNEEYLNILKINSNKLKTIKIYNSNYSGILDISNSINIKEIDLKNNEYLRGIIINKSIRELNKSLSLNLYQCKRMSWFIDFDEYINRYKEYLFNTYKDDPTITKTIYNSDNNETHSNYNVFNLTNINLSLFNIYCVLFIKNIIGLNLDLTASYNNDNILNCVVYNGNTSYNILSLMNSIGKCYIKGSIKLPINATNLFACRSNMVFNIQSSNTGDGLYLENLSNLQIGSGMFMRCDELIYNDVKSIMSSLTKLQQGVQMYSYCNKLEFPNNTVPASLFNKCTNLVNATMMFSKEYSSSKLLTLETGIFDKITKCENLNGIFSTQTTFSIGGVGQGLAPKIYMINNDKNVIQSDMVYNNSYPISNVKRFHVDIFKNLTKLKNPMRMFNTIHEVEVDVSNVSGDNNDNQPINSIYQNNINITNYNGMFAGCKSIKYVNNANYNNKPVTINKYIFYKNNLSNNSCNVTDMTRMFNTCIGNVNEIVGAINGSYLSKYNTNVDIDFENWFEYVSLDSRFSCSNMFANYKGDLSSVWANDFNKDIITDMSFMFANSTFGDYKLNDDDILPENKLSNTLYYGNFTQSTVGVTIGKRKINSINKDHNIFSNYDNITKENKGFNKLTNISGMFYNCQKLSNVYYINNQELISFNGLPKDLFKCLPNITSVAYLFGNCENFDFSFEDNYYMFENCIKLTDFSGVFSNCKKLSGQIPKYESIGETLNDREKYYIDLSEVRFIINDNTNYDLIDLWYNSLSENVINIIKNNDEIHKTNGNTDKVIFNDDNSLKRENLINEDSFKAAFLNIVKYIDKDNVVHYYQYYKERYSNTLNNYYYAYEFYNCPFNKDESGNYINDGLTQLQQQIMSIYVNFKGEIIDKTNYSNNNSLNYIDNNNKKFVKDLKTNEIYINIFVILEEMKNSKIFIPGFFHIKPDNNKSLLVDKILDKKIASLYKAFSGCSGLTDYIPGNIFRCLSMINDLSHVFSDCYLIGTNIEYMDITKILPENNDKKTNKFNAPYCYPIGLFDDCENLKYLDYAFNNISFLTMPCTITYIGAGIDEYSVAIDSTFINSFSKYNDNYILSRNMFRYNTKLVSLSGCFKNDTNTINNRQRHNLITYILPPNLFIYNVNITNLSECFMNSAIYGCHVVSITSSNEIYYLGSNLLLPLIRLNSVRNMFRNCYNLQHLSYYGSDDGPNYPLTASSMPFNSNHSRSLNTKDFVSLYIIEGRKTIVCNNLSKYDYKLVNVYNSNTPAILLSNCKTVWDYFTGANSNQQLLSNKPN